jgi:hypothetical protein
MQRMGAHPWINSSKKSIAQPSAQPRATAVRYDKMRRRIVVELSTGSEFAFPPHQAQGLESATPGDLRAIGISPSGYGLHFPKLDADLWLPALVGGGRTGGVARFMQRADEDDSGGRKPRTH